MVILMWYNDKTFLELFFFKIPLHIIIVSHSSSLLIFYIIYKYAEFGGYLSSHLSPISLAVVGAPQMMLQQYVYTLHCLPLLSGYLQTPFPSILNVISPSLLLSSSPCSFHCPLQKLRIVFAMPEDLETWPYHLSFHFLTMVR